MKTLLATTTNFRAEDPNDPRFFIFATLGSGVLRFEVIAQLSTGERGTVTGKGLFGAMMAHFGGRVRSIEANWSRASGLTTNLDQLNRAMIAGLGENDAASLTWTGLRASEFGYDKIAVNDLSGFHGDYEIARVEFGR